MCLKRNWVDIGTASIYYICPNIVHVSRFLHDFYYYYELITFNLDHSIIIPNETSARGIFNHIFMMFMLWKNSLDARCNSHHGKGLHRSTADCAVSTRTQCWFNFYSFNSFLQVRTHQFLKPLLKRIRLLVYCPSRSLMFIENL